MQFPDYLARDDEGSLLGYALVIEVGNNKEGVKLLTELGVPPSSWEILALLTNPSNAQSNVISNALLQAIREQAGNNWVVMLAPRNVELKTNALSLGFSVFAQHPLWRIGGRDILRYGPGEEILRQPNSTADAPGFIPGVTVPPVRHDGWYDPHGNFHSSGGTSHGSIH